MRFPFVGLIVLCCLFSCSNKKKNEIDISKINVNFSVKRYDVDFYNATKETLPKVKNKYPYLFPIEFTDSLALARINDEDEQELFVETQKIYKDFSSKETQLKSLFKHVKYYNPKFKSPDIITMLSNIDYKSRVIYADSLMLISLDVYLGKNHLFYTDYRDFFYFNRKYTIHYSQEKYTYIILKFYSYSYFTLIYVIILILIIA